MSPDTGVVGSAGGARSASATSKRVRSGRTRGCRPRRRGARRRPRGPRSRGGVRRCRTASARWRAARGPTRRWPPATGTARTAARRPSRRAAARRPARRTAASASALRQAANAAAPRDPAAITPSHSRIASRTGSPAGPGARSRTIAHSGSAEIANESPWMPAKSSTVRSSRPRSSAWIRAARCGGANSLPSSSLSLPAPLVGGHHLAVGRRRRGAAARPSPTRCRRRARGRCRAGWPRRAPAPGRRCGTGPRRCGRR